MNEQIKTIDETGDRKYFTILQNFIFDLPLSVYSFRVYAHIKRVAGEGGVCWQAIRTIAKRCKISPSSVSRAVKELQKFGLIDVTKIANPTNGYSYTEIRIRDVWKHNMNYFNMTEEQREEQRQFWEENRP